MEEPKDQLQVIPLSDIWADEEFNSRGHITPASVASLADDIARQGLLQPIVVQKFVNNDLGTKFKIVAGHRRFDAFGLLKRTDPKYSSIPCVVISRVLDPGEALVMNIKENLEREPLNMLQEAHAIVKFKELGWDSREVARRLGQTKAWVEVRFGIPSLSQVIQKRIEANFLNQYQVQQCLTMCTPDEQYEYVRNIVDHREREKLLKVHEPKESKRTPRTVNVAAKGVARTPAEMFLVQESIQDSFGDNKHPAAVALAWAAGVLSYEEFLVHIRKWASEAGLEYQEHEEILKRAG